MTIPETSPAPQPPLSSSAQRVQAALAKLGFTLSVVELPQSTRTAAEAASAVGRAGWVARWAAVRERERCLRAIGRTRIGESPMFRADLWAAAGTPNAVFQLAPKDLVAMSQGQVAQIKK